MKTSRHKPATRSRAAVSRVVVGTAQPRGRFTHIREQTRAVIETCAVGYKPLKRT